MATTHTLINPGSTVALPSGNTMPVIGIGTWQLTERTAELVRQALGLGVRMIDASGDYGTQPGVGDGIRSSKVDRRNLFLVTKVEETGNSYDAARQNLSELRMTYADLMLIHRPPDHGSGSELWLGLQRTQSNGFAKDIGVSNYSIDRLEALTNATGDIPAVNQIEWTPFGHSKDMLDYCRQHGIVIQAYSPLTRGDRLSDHTLQSIAAAHGKTPGQVMLRWDLQLGVVPIVKAGNPAHLAEDLDIFDFELSDQDMDALHHLNESYSALGTLPYV